MKRNSQLGLFIIIVVVVVGVAVLFIPQLPVTIKVLIFLIPLIFRPITSIFGKTKPK